MPKFAHSPRANRTRSTQVRLRTQIRYNNASAKTIALISYHQDDKFRIVIF